MATQICVTISKPSSSKSTKCRAVLDYPCILYFSQLTPDYLCRKLSAKITRPPYLCHPAIPPRPAYCTNPNEGTKDNWWLIPTNRIIIIIIIFIYIVFFMDDCLHLYDFYVEFNYRYSIYLYSCINTVKRVLNFAANSLLQLCVCTVIFDAGLGASSDSWFLVYQEISKFTKVTSLWNWIIICSFIGPAIK